MTSGSRELYFIVKAVIGDDWHAVVTTGDEPAGTVVEPIGTGTSIEAYYYCINHWHWGIISPKPQDSRRRAE